MQIVIAQFLQLLWFGVVLLWTEQVAVLPCPAPPRPALLCPALPLSALSCSALLYLARLAWLCCAQKLCQSLYSFSILPGPVPAQPSPNLVQTLSYLVLPGPFPTQPGPNPSKTLQTWSLPYPTWS